MEEAGHLERERVEKECMMEDLRMIEAKKEKWERKIFEEEKIMEWSILME